MNTRLAALGVLLGLQIVLVAFLLARDAFDEPQGEKLLDFDPSAITTLTISAGEERVVLAKADDQWRVDDSWPGDATRIGELLDKLAALRAPWPVATTTEAAERFEVAEDDHQRRIVLATSDGEVANVLLGTSPGYRRLHVRREDSSDVYSVDLAHHELAAEPDHWLDKGVLSSTGEVRTVVLAGAWTLAHADDAWTIDGAPADTEAADRLAERFEDLQVLGLADPKLEWVEKGRFAVTDDGGTWNLVAYHAGEPDEYAFEADRTKGRYTVASYIAEQMIVDAETLAAKAVAPEEGAEADADAAPSSGDEPPPADAT